MHIQKYYFAYRIVVAIYKHTAQWQRKGKRSWKLKTNLLLVIYTLKSNRNIKTRFNGLKNKNLTFKWSLSLNIQWNISIMSPGVLKKIVPN